MSVFFVYVDWTAEHTPRPFYVGKGKHARIHKRERNAHWKAIAAKHGWRREVILATKEEAFAFTQEILGIRELGTFERGMPEQWGANKTSGGEGVSGTVMSSERRTQMSLLRKGIKQRPLNLTPETRERMRAAKRGDNNPNKRPENRAKIGTAHRGEKSWCYGRVKPLSERLMISGDKHGMAKLNWNQVHEIRFLFDYENLSQAELVRIFHVSPMTIHRVVKRKNWTT